MKKEYEYITLGCGEKYPDDAISFSTHLPPTETDWLAETAAEDLWNNHDGWEATWPQTIHIFYKGKSLGKFLVNMEAAPGFYATEIVR